MNTWDMPAAFIVRHGETELNTANCWRGWENPALNEEGRQAAEAIANFFSWQRVGRVICSDLGRAMETAQYIMGTGNVCCPYVSPDPNLRSWAIGGFAGMKKTAASLARFKKFTDDPDLKIPDSEQHPGESLNDFRARNERMTEYIATPYMGLPTVIVVHTSNITALQRLISEVEGNEEESIDVVAPGGVLAVYMDTDGNLEMVPRLGEIKAEPTPEVS